MFGIAHLDIAPLAYGVLMFVGIWLLWRKLMKGRFLSFIASLCVFYMVFALHGGTMAGGFSAMIAALIFDLVVFPPWRKS
jgi:uncharacterized membrane protein (DUF2068 family)